MTSIVRYATFLLVALAPALRAQAGSSIARRVADAPNGEVRMTYASRSSACGDGKDVVAIGDDLTIHRSMESFGHWSGVRCVPGPARVALTVRDHEVVDLRTYIGGSWSSRDGARGGPRPRARRARPPTTSCRSRPRSARASSNNPLLAAAAADSANVSPEMLRLARTTSLPRETRRRAVHWAGVLGDASTVAPLVAMARAGEEGRSNADDVGPGDSMAGAAVGALAMIPDDAGVPALMELARRGSVSVRKAAVFWLGQGESKAGRDLVRTIAADDNESETLRGAAIFALGQGDGIEQRRRRASCASCSASSRASVSRIEC